MLVELRQYRTLPGQRENWVRFFHEVIAPFQTSKGIRILGTWVAEEEDDLFVWMREFDDEEARLRLYADVYESDYWKNEVSPKVGDMLQRGKAVITRLNTTDVASPAAT